MDIEQLGEIQKVSPSELLYERIQHKIIANRKAQISHKMALAIHISIVILMVINVLVLVKSSTKTSDAQIYAQSIQIISNNNLYQ